MGSVEVLVLTFPSAPVPAALPAVVRSLAERDGVTVLDLVVLERVAGTAVLVVEDESDLGGVGLGGVVARPRPLLSQEDLDLVVAGLEPGSTAAVVVLEHTWLGDLADAVRAAGGQVGLHVRVPAEDVETALAVDGPSSEAG